MTDLAAVFARLVGDDRRFLDEHFGVAPLHRRRADTAGFADLLSLDDVDHLVASSGLRAPAFRLVRDGTTLPRSAVTRSARIGSRPVDDLIDVAAVHRAFADGASIVLQGLHRSWPPVATTCRALEIALTHPVQANAYLTPPVAQGLDLHADPHDVFVLQTHGAKRWVVHPADDERWDLELEPGDLLYLPAGTRHAAQTLDTASLHLTVGVRTMTWADLVRDAIDDTVAAMDLDRPLPGGWADDPGQLTEQLDAWLSVAAERLTEGPRGDTLAAAAAGFWAGRVPDLRGGLHDLLGLDAIEDSTSLRVRPAATARLEVDGDRLRLVLGDRVLHAPASLAPTVRRLLELGTFAPKELDDLIDGSSRAVLCRRLVREGLLTIDRGPDPAGG